MLLSLTALLILPVLSAQTWDETLKAAQGKTVYFNAWGGSPLVNKYLSDLAKRAKTQYGITLVHVKVNDISESIVRILAEKAAGKTNGGKVDLVWINGENFYTMKKNGLLFGPFVKMLPNIKYIDLNSPAISYDFSLPSEGYESPWGLSQFVFIYDSAKVKTPPRVASEFLTYAKANPGRLTYPQLPDFTGTTFIKQMLYNLAPNPGMLLKEATDELYNAQTKALWAWLEEITPYLWQKGESYPKNATELRELLNQGSIDVSYSFAPFSAAADVQNNDLPSTVRTYIPDSLTIGNTHFVGIPFNSDRRNDASLVIANMLLSPAEQLEKFEPKNWGDFTVLSLTKMPAEYKAKFLKVNLGPQTLPIKSLGNILPEPHPSWVGRLEADWKAFQQK